MKMLLWTLTIAFSLASSISAAEERAFKYEEGRAAVRAHEQAMQKAVKEYAAAVHAARKEYAAALDAALKAAMERGDLDEANRLNAAKKAVGTELAVSSVAQALPQEAVVPSNALPTLVGTWRFENGTSIVCQADGTYTRQGYRDSRPAVWRHLGGRKFMLGKDVIELSPDLKSFANPNPRAKGQIVRRVLPVNHVAESKTPK